jgi:hypothetical protein
MFEFISSIPLGHSLCFPRAQHHNWMRKTKQLVQNPYWAQMFSGWQAVVVVLISVLALLVTGQVIASRRARKRERLVPQKQAASPSGYEREPAPEKAA